MNLVKEVSVVLCVPVFVFAGSGSCRFFVWNQSQNLYIRYLSESAHVVY
jgi:hypothetical protein